MKSSMYGSRSPSKAVAKSIQGVVVEEHEAHVVDTADLACATRLPPNRLRNARVRSAPPGANGTMIVSSETLPSRLPTRPALATGIGGVCGRL